MNQTTDTIIIGAGLSGLTVAHKLRTSCYGHRSIILEKSNSTGGVIRSYHENGYTAEIGPHGFLDNCIESNALLKETGLDKECIKSPLINFVRYVFVDGRLKMIPQTPLKILAAPLIPWSAKLRVLADLWKEPLSGEPTVAKWVSHRFGPALLPYVDAVFTGTYAGDMDKLTIDSVMPGVRKVEKETGSVIRGLIAKAKRAKSNGSTNGRKLTMPAMTSFPQGMARLPERLSEYLKEGVDLHLNCTIKTIAKKKNGWLVETDSDAFHSANLVVATSINNGLSLLQDITSPPPIDILAEASIATVVFGFGPGEKLPPGFGYLAPEQEGRFSLGSLFSSNMFPGRAPAGHILFETLIGGRRHPERLSLSDEELIERALQDVREILSLKSRPIYTKVLSPWGAIPQLEQDYPALLAWRDKIESENPGLYLCGFGWNGIGLNDMMKHAFRVADAVHAGTEKPELHAEVKGVYF